MGCREMRVENGCFTLDIIVQGVLGCQYKYYGNDIIIRKIDIELLPAHYDGLNWVCTYNLVC